MCALFKLGYTDLERGIRREAGFPGGELDKATFFRIFKQ